VPLEPKDIIANALERATWPNYNTYPRSAMLLTCPHLAKKFKPKLLAITKNSYLLPFTYLEGSEAFWSNATVIEKV